jgi:predicted acyltransferase
MVTWVGLAIILISVLAMTRPVTRAGRIRNLLLIVGPLAVFGFGLNWFLVLLAKGLQENCDPHCVEWSDVHIARALFFTVVASWLLGLAVYFGRRRPARRAEPSERVEPGSS